MPTVLGVFCALCGCKPLISRTKALTAEAAEKCRRGRREMLKLHYYPVPLFWLRRCAVTVVILGKSDFGYMIRTASWELLQMNIDDLLRIAMERRASDLHLKVGNYPHLRIDGELVPLTDQPRVSAEDMLTMAFSMMSTRQKQKFKETAELDMAYGVAGLGRFRVNVFQQRGNVGMVLRVIPTKIRTLDELYLPKIVEQICEMPRGLVLVTGMTGSGKSTTLAAMVDRINSTRAEHIITIEDPIEFLHRDKKGFVNQREVEVDTPTFSSALRAALRQDPDVILVGEMRDLETIATALHAAETGHMVFSTLHTLDAVETINRIIAVFPPPEQKQIRLQLAAMLRAVISQRLVRRCDGKGACPPSK